MWIQDIVHPTRGIHYPRMEGYQESTVAWLWWRGISCRTTPLVSAIFSECYWHPSHRTARVRHILPVGHTSYGIVNLLVLSPALSQPVEGSPATALALCWHYLWSCVVQGTDYITCGVSLLYLYLTWSTLASPCSWKSPCFHLTANLYLHVMFITMMWVPIMPCGVCFGETIRVNFFNIVSIFLCASFSPGYVFAQVDENPIFWSHLFLSQWASLAQASIADSLLPVLGPNVKAAQDGIIKLIPLAILFILICVYGYLVAREKIPNVSSGTLCKWSDSFWSYCQWCFVN